VLLLALSTEHKVGLGLAVLVFAGFALIASMLVPRWWPQFPGRGLTVFVIATVLLFLGMISAVEFFGKESGEAKAEGAAETAASQSQSQATATARSTATTQTGAARTSLQATEAEYKIKLAKTSLAAGSYTFDVENDGKFPHDLVVKGNGVNEKTPTIDAGKSAALKVDLKPGAYDVYCSIPGHKQLGMDVKLTVTS
jgi:uncharacterized cupredoxin-like copper-binding protein